MIKVMLKKTTTIFILILMFCLSLLTAQTETRVVAAIASVKGDAQVRPVDERRYNSAY